jgi:hypothetical protein
VTQLPRSKIEKAAYVKDDRPVLGGVYLDTGGCFMASNGLIAAKVPVESVDEGLESGLIPLASVKAIRKAKRDIMPDEVAPAGKFPSGYIHDQLLDVPAEAPIIVLDAAQLYKLAQAICTSSSHLCIGLYLPRRYRKSVMVKEMGGEGIGLLMEMNAEASCNLRVALDELRGVLVDGDPINGALRAKLRKALVEG